MTKLRYVKTLDQYRKAKESNPEFLESSVSSIRCVYETDRAVAEALVPKPLAVTETPQLCATFSHVAMHITPEFTFEIGSALLGIKVEYEGVEGIYLITMPMTTEQAVVGGRETFGEPKKIADIEFKKDGDQVSSTVSRMGMTYMTASGKIGAELGPREVVEHAYCFKAMPSCDADKNFDYDPLLVRLEWRHTHKNSWAVEGGELGLLESPMDPVADIPLGRMLRFEYEEGTSESNGTVLKSVPQDYLLPFIHQRYDDTSGDGVEIAV